MGLLVDGRWVDEWYETKSNGGEFRRENAQLRHWITADGTAGPTGDGGFKAESGRYHLYVSLACPWAHRTLIFRKLKDLEKHISVSIVSHDMLENGWTFDKHAGSTGDEVNQKQYLYEIYANNDPHYTGRVTVPVLWDKNKAMIVNNESADIIRMFNQAFDNVTGNKADYYPKKLQSEIDEINAYIYDNINNGVYKCGFATTQEAYEKAYKSLFKALDKVESILSQTPYLVGDTMTEADWRLFTTLIRFDMVYYSHFKCNQQRIDDYPYLGQYVRKLYQYGDIRETVDFHHIKRHYYYSQTTINPTQIVPIGPAIDFST